jgi:hypothetical protein
MRLVTLPNSNGWTIPLNWNFFIFPLFRDHFGLLRYGSEKLVIDKIKNCDEANDRLNPGRKSLVTNTLAGIYTKYKIKKIAMKPTTD